MHDTDNGGPTRRAMLVGLALAAPVVAAGCSSGTKHSAPSTSHPTTGTGTDRVDDTTILIVRHGEKPANSDAGLDESGRADKKSLTKRGWQRAHALPGLFIPTPGRPAPLLPRPATIFAASDQGPHAGAHRMRQTVTPLAEALHIPVDTSIAEHEEKQLATAALAAKAPVLICWEHSRIPHIVDAVGAAGVANVPKEWPDRFDLVWEFTRKGGAWSFRALPQNLLGGDARTA